MYETTISLCNFRRILNFIYKNIIIADINKMRYNISVVLPIPGNRGRCSSWKFLFLLLLLSWLVWLATASTNG